MNGFFSRSKENRAIDPSSTVVEVESVPCPACHAAVLRVFELTLVHISKFYQIVAPQYVKWLLPCCREKVMPTSSIEKPSWKNSSPMKGNKK